MQIAPAQFAPLSAARSMTRPDDSIVLSAECEKEQKKEETHNCNSKRKEYDGNSVISLTVFKP